MKQLELFNHTKPPALCEGVGTGLRETEQEPHATAHNPNVREMLHENETEPALKLNPIVRDMLHENDTEPALVLNEVGDLGKKEGGSSRGETITVSDARSAAEPSKLMTSLRGSSAASGAIASVANWGFPSRLIKNFFKHLKK